jgi:integrase
LKIGTRGGRVNEYHINLTDYCPEFIPVLEEFLQVYRPRLPNPTGSTLLFLSHRGKPFSAQSLGPELSRAVAQRTGQRFYPHLIRTIWATEYLTDTDTPDWITAAVMLGDTVATVMARYHDLVDQAHHPKAKAFLNRALHTG